MPREMPPSPPPRSSRINLRDLQSQMAAKLGPDRAQRYFRHLSRFLVQKQRKVEFDALCLEILGLENVGLHNRFLRSILWNASQAKLPSSSIHGKDAPKLNKAAAKKPPSANEFLLSPFIASGNGDLLLSSPRRSRSTIYRAKDHQSSHQRPNGKVNAAPMEKTGGAEAPAKKQRVEKPSSNDLPEAAALEDAETDRPPIQAPLGVQHCSTVLSGSRYTSPGFISGDGELSGTEALRDRMERIASAKGVAGVTMECANLLNKGLDAYLKRLIASCVDLATFKQQGHGKMVNDQHLERDSGSPRRRLLMLDLRVAMEMNPQQLGGHWPSLLEKAGLRSFED